MISLAELRPKVDLSTMESLRTVKDKAWVQFRHKMGFSRVISRRMRLMDLESSSGKMVKFTREISESPCSMEKARLFTRTEKLQKESGKRTTTELCQQLSVDI